MKKPRYSFPIAETEAGSLIKRRRLQLLVHSCIYYVLDQNIISDEQFDKWAYELVNLMKKHPDAYSDRFDFAFESWDGTTGFDSPVRDPWVVSTAQMLLNIEEK